MSKNKGLLIILGVVTAVTLFANPGKWLSESTRANRPEDFVFDRAPASVQKPKALTKVKVAPTPAFVDRNHLLPSYQAPSAPIADFTNSYTPPVLPPQLPSNDNFSIPYYPPIPYRSVASNSGYSNSKSSAANPRTSADSSSSDVQPAKFNTPANETHSGSSTSDSSGSVVAPAAAAQNLTAVGESGLITLNWNALEGTGISYAVERSTSASGPFTAVSAFIQATTYVDSAVVNGTRYYYRIRSLNVTGGTVSDIASAIPSSLPSDPVLLVTAADGTASLVWTASTGVGPITYNVERSITSGSGYAPLGSALTGTVFTDSSVVNGTVYYYRVNAQNLAGNSNFSTIMPAKPIASFIMGTATAGQDSVAVTWNSAVGADQYDVKYGTATGTYTTTLTNKTSPFVVTGLTAGTPYFFSITASNSQNGLSISTNELSATPLGPFSITSLTANGIGKLDIAWNTSTAATSYDVQCGTTSGTYTTTLTNQTSPATINGLSDGSTYYCSVLAKNSGGSFASAEASTDTLSLLTYTWPFDAGTDSIYSFDSSKLELVGGVSRLRNRTPVDASYMGNDFLAATLSGVKWDSPNSKLTLDTTTSDGELNARWTPKYNQIVGYWKLNGTPEVSIPNGRAVLATIGKNGTTKNPNGTGLNYTNGKQFQGLQTDGVDDVIEIPDHAALHFGTQPFSAQMWIKRSAGAGCTVMWNNAWALNQWHTGGSPGTNQWSLTQCDGTTTNRFGITIESGTTSYVVNDADGHNLEQWYHVVGVREATSLKIYVDGKLKNTTTIPASASVNNLGLPLQLAGSTLGTLNAKSAFDEIAIWSTGLSASDVKTIYERQSARYTGTILSRVIDSGASTAWQGLNYLTSLPYGKELPDNRSSTVGYWTLDESSAGTVSGTDFKDLTYQGGNGTKVGTFNSVAGKIGKAQTFNGVDQSINAGTFTALNGSSAFTITAWTKQNSGGAATQEIIRKDNQFAMQVSGGQIVLAIRGTTWAYSGWTTATINDDQWHKVVGRYDGNLLQVYIDGILKASTAVGAMALQSNTNPLHIGSLEGTYEFFSGAIDDVAIYSRALSVDEITNSQPTSLMAGNVGLWHFNGSTADTSGNGNNFTAAGTLDYPSQGKLKDAAKLSLGTYLTAPNSATLNHTSQMSFSTWFKPSAIPATYAEHLISKWSSTTDANYVLYFFGTGSPAPGFLRVYANAGGGWTTVSSGYVVPQLNEWIHIGWSYDKDLGGQLYINGKPYGVREGGGPLANSTQSLGMCASTPGLCEATFDETAIWGRSLSSTEMEELYQRGANKLILQARTCSAADCSDDASNANWKGSLGTADSYFSEANNATQAQPALLFSDFGVSLPNQSHFQYRAVLQSDTSDFSPDLKSVAAGPARFDGSNPTIIPIDGPKYQIYTGFATTLGASCSGTPRFQLSHDKKVWYYYSAGMWNTTTAGVTQASDSTTINTHIGTFSAVAGTGELYAKIFYPSDTTTACEISAVAVSGADLNDTASANPNAFQITSTSIGDSSVTLNWTAATGATSYKVCYGITQALANACATYVTVTGTSTTISSLTNNTGYYFSVVASNPSGATASNLPVATTPIAAPSTPTTLVAQKGITVINLSWTASSGAGNISYTVKRGTGAGGPYSAIATGLTSNAYTDASATPGTAYYYVVTATNASGTSANSNEATATAMSHVQYAWTFDEGTDSSYTFDPAKIELVSGVSRLRNYTPTDASYTGNDFLSAQLSGLKWDSSQSAIVLDSTSDDGELSSTWTPQYNKIVGYWKFNGSAESNINTGAVLRGTIGSDAVAHNDNTGMRITYGKQKQGLTFTDADDYVTASPDIDVANDITVQIWIKTSASGITQLPIAKYGGSDHGWLLNIAPTNDIAFDGRTGTGVYYRSGLSTTKVTDGVWHHIVGVRAGATFKIYVDGKLENSLVNDAGSFSHPTRPIFFSSNDGSYPFVGTLDEPAIWNVALSDAEIKTIYERQSGRHTGTLLSRVMSLGTSTTWEGLRYLTKLPYGKEIRGTNDEPIISLSTNAVSSISSGLVGYWRMDDLGTTFADGGANGNTGTSVGSPTFQQKGTLNRSVLFSGTGQAVEIPNSPSINITGNQISAGAWVYLNAYDTYDSSILARMSSYYFTIDPAGVPRVYLHGTTGDNWQVSTVAVPLKTWTHLAFTYDGSNTKIFINGVSTSSVARSGSIVSSTNPLRISGVGGEINRHVNGRIDEVALWNRGLSDTEIQTFMDSTRSISSELVGLYHLNEASITGAANEIKDSSPNAYHGTSNVALTSESGQIGRGIRFTGMDQYVTLPANATLNTIDQGDYTISAWYKPERSMGAIFMKYGFHGGLWYDGRFRMDRWDSTNVAAAAISGSKAFGNLYHAVGVVSKTSGFIKIYVNGVLESTQPFTPGLAARDYGTVNWRIGAIPSSITYYSSGMIDDVGLWSRALTDSEVKHMYDRGASRIILQTRTCNNPGCSDDTNDSYWKGSGATLNSYFSEANNATASPPNFLYTNFGMSAPNQPYFQYRAILQSDLDNTSPALTSVSAGPAKYEASNPIIVPINGPSFQELVGFNALFGGNGCSGVPKFQLSTDKQNWYYYASGMWTPATAGITQASSVATINSNISTLQSVTGIGNLYVKAFLPSNSTTACEIDSIVVNGGDQNPTISTNPNAFKITSTAAGNGSATLSWNTATGATSYTICYGTTQALADSCATYVTVTGNSTTVTGLTNNTSYFFNVNATTASGRTPASTSSSTTPMAPPTTPTTLIAAANLFSVQLNWTASTGTGPITYTIKRGTVSGTYTTLVSGLTTPAYTDFTATANTQFFYVVTSKNTGGTSANSNEVTATALGSFNITASTAGVGSATLTWGAASGASSYSISYGTASNSYSTTVTGQTSPATITGLTAGTTYFFVVKATNSSGAATSSQEVKVIPTQTFTYNWPFTNSTDSSYSFDNTLLSIANNACQLTPFTWTDDDNIAAGFAGGTKYGVTWDSGSHSLKLDATNSQKELAAGWTPKFSDIKHYWKMNGTVGSAIANGATVSDSVGSANLTSHNTNGLGFGYIDGKVSSGVTFDGVDDYLSGSGGWNPGTSDFSYALWVNVPSGNTTRIFNKRNSAGVGSFFSTLVMGSYAAIEICNDASGSLYTLVNGTKTVADGTWHHLIFVRKGTSLSIFVDGKLDITQNSASTINVSNTADYQFNAVTSIPTAYPSAAVDETAIWGSALTAEEVRVIYEHQQEAYSGTYISRVFNAGHDTPWSGFSWLTAQPAGKELPANLTNDNITQYPDASTTLANGMVGLWHLNDTAFNTLAGSKDIKDDSGNGYHGEAETSWGTLGSPGKFNTSIAFNVNGQVKFDVPSTTFSGGLATFSMWMKWKGQDSIMPLGFSNYDVIMIGTGMGFNSGNGDSFGFSGTTGFKDRWVHLVFEFHTGNYTLNKIYVDGVSQSLSQLFGTQHATTTNGLSTATAFALNGYLTTGGYRAADGTAYDELAAWNRALTQTEVDQLYRRGATQVKFQVRTCSASDCSDDSTAANWKGPDGTVNTFFSEANNATAGAVKATAPAMNFASLGVTVPSGQYIQYKAILESAINPSTFTPSLKAATVGPVYDKNATGIFTVNGSLYETLTGFSVTLGTGGCNGDPKFQFSKDKSTWYYNNGTTWVVGANNSYIQSNTIAGANSKMSTFASVLGTGTIYVKAYLPSTGAVPCVIDDIQITGTKR